MGQEQAELMIAKALAPSLPTRRLPAALLCKLLLLLLQDSQNSAHPWPWGRSCTPGWGGMALWGERGCRVCRVPGAPGHGDVAELSLVSPQWAGTREGRAAMAAEMALSHRAPREALSEADLEEVAQRIPPAKPSLRSCLRKTR